MSEQRKVKTNYSLNRFLLFLFIALVALVLITDTIPRIQTYLLIASVSQINDPINFTKNFNPNGYSPISFDVRVAGSLIGSAPQDYYVSSLYPHDRLSIWQLNEVPNNTEDHLLVVDKNWKVFFVEVISPNGSETNFYGPFRSKQDIMEILNEDSLKKLNPANY